MADIINDANCNGLHIVMCPWLAFGHMLPYLELSKSLARRGHRISYISTPRNILRLPKLPPEVYDLINFIPLHMPKVEGLPESAEATSDIPSESVEHMKAAFDRLDEPFRKFIKETTPKPDWIIHDFSHHWVPRIAADAGVPTVLFMIFSTAFLVFYGPPSELAADTASRTTPEQFAVTPPWIPFSSNLRFRLHEARRIFKDNCTSNVSGFSDRQRLGIGLEGCSAVAVRSCMEMEGDWLKLAPKILQKPVLPVGALPEQVVDGRGGDEGEDIIRWLDKQTSASVAYIAFGSEAPLSTELLHHLALGIELAKIPFVWAFRKPEGRPDEEEYLPEGFEERTKEYGIVAKGWVPQLKILAHGSVGGFLTHLGWGSVVEGLQFGRPLVLLPIFADQGINARVVVAIGVAAEIERDEDDGSFTKEAVAKALRLAIVEEEGESLRSRAKELKEVVGDKDRQEKYVDDFVRYLQNPDRLETVMARDL